MVKKTKKRALAQGQDNFELGDLVAAKVKGYPIWPGMIEDIRLMANNRKKYVVRFFSTNDSCDSYITIKPFCQMTASERSCSKKDFVKAIQLCQEEEKRRAGAPSNVRASKQQTTKEQKPKKREAREKASQQTNENEEEEKAEGAREDQGEEDMIEMHADEVKAASPKPAVQSEQANTALPPTPETLGSNDDEEAKNHKAEGQKGFAIEEKETCAKMDRNKVKEEPDEEENAEEEAGPVLIEKAEENNNTENAEHDDGCPDEKIDYLPDLSSPDDDNEGQQSKVEAKNEDSTKHCSLNDLTSEQANADRGNKPPSNRATNMQATDRELTIAKLKKKLAIKLREKEEKKAAFKDQKSFEKALKGLPAFERKFNPLSRSTARFLESPNNTHVSNQVKASIKNCEKYLEPLARCLKLMTTDYGEQRHECFQFHSNLREIVERLKAIKANKAYSIRADCSSFLKVLKTSDNIKSFMNKMKFPLFYNNNTVTERKENSKAKRKSALRSEQLIARVTSRQ